MDLFSNERITILDGATGTMIQRFSLTEDDYSIPGMASALLKGNNECLNLSRPDVISAIHKEYIEAGADIIEANTFSANRISQAEYGCEGIASRMAFEGARIAREAADGAGRKVIVAGSMGPTSKSLSLSPDVADPGFRQYTFGMMKESYKEQAGALLDGGADILLLETCFDALNVKAALSAIQELNDERGLSEPIPVIVSVSVGDRSGRTLTGQTLKAFYTALRHYPLAAFGLNCSLGAEELTPLMQEVSQWCGCRTICYPNAGLPNEMGGYDQTPEQMAQAVGRMAREGLLDITGGCCGTTPEHIRAVARAVHGIAPRGEGRCSDPSFDEGVLTVSGLEAVTIDIDRFNFTNIGERTNVAGSRKFAKLIAAGDYDTALQIAARQIEDGASIIDINMDDAMLDSRREMERFVRYISNDPNVAKAALMIDSSHWETVLAGLENAQGKCIVNSISLKEGEEAFIAKAKVLRSFGAATVVMAFDEKGQATTFDRKIEICERAYRLLTEKAAMAPEDIIFDCNILSIGTGIAEHADYGVDFIRAVRWIKENLPGAKTSGGVSNLSFAFRGNNPVREAMHSAFLFHAIEAGLDMAIVNPSMLQVYDDIEPSLLKCVEDVIFNKDAEAVERLVDKASEILASKENAAPEVRQEDRSSLPLEDRLRNALVKGLSDHLAEDIEEAMGVYGKAVSIIEGPLMAGMESVGDMFGQGKMFLPQVVKSAKVMRDAVALLEPYMGKDEDEGASQSSKPVIVIATVKGDVHDIGKNITAIVLTCNGFEVHDLGVMVDRETILAEAEKLHADIVAVSGLITPSLYQMEEICREMAARGMDVPLFIGGATTSALHTAVKLAPLYNHVYYGPDASASAVMAKKYMMDRASFEEEQHARQAELRDLYEKGRQNAKATENVVRTGLDEDGYVTDIPDSMEVREITYDMISEYFDWKMFYAVWGIRYGKQVPEATELIQLRKDAEEELAFRNFRIRVGVRFTEAYGEGDDIVLPELGKRLPMMRQESGKGLSLSDLVIPKESGKVSAFGAFAISVHKADEHVEGCCCPACSNRYEDMVGRSVRMTLAEAASSWLDRQILDGKLSPEGRLPEGAKVVKPAAGYASCPDHTLKKDLLEIIPGGERLDIALTESYAMIPDASICGMVFIHPQACYPEIRNVSGKQYGDYLRRRGMSEDEGRRFLGHLLK
ncbi:MAG: methionine synthase [Candidatus Cryptobacteroides sp.]